MVFLLQKKGLQTIFPPSSLILFCLQKKVTVHYVKGEVVGLVKQIGSHRFPADSCEDHTTVPE